MCRFHDFEFVFGNMVSPILLEREKRDLEKPDFCPALFSWRGSKLRLPSRHSRGSESIFFSLLYLLQPTY